MDRRKKIKFANLSKRILPFHKWIGTSALFLIGIHATLAIQRFGFHMQNTKITSGLITGIILTIVVITGWMRLFRPSAKKRMAHLYLGLTMFFFIIVHLIL